MCRSWSPCSRVFSSFSLLFFLVPFLSLLFFIHPFPSLSFFCSCLSFLFLLVPSLFFLFLLVLSLPYLILLVHSRSFSILLDSLVPSLFLLVPCLSFLFLLFPSFPGPLSFLSATAPFHIMFSFESPRFLSPVDLPYAYLPSSLQRSRCLFAPFPSLFRRFSAETRGSSPEIAGLLFILPFLFSTSIRLHRRGHSRVPLWKKRRQPHCRPSHAHPHCSVGREGGMPRSKGGVILGVGDGERDRGKGSRSGRLLRWEYALKRANIPQGKGKSGGGGGERGREGRRVAWFSDDEASSMASSCRKYLSWPSCPPHVFLPPSLPSLPPSLFLFPHCLLFSYPPCPLPIVIHPALPALPPSPPSFPSSLSPSLPLPSFLRQPPM